MCASSRNLPNAVDAPRPAPQSPRAVTPRARSRAFLALPLLLAACRFPAAGPASAPPTPAPAAPPEVVGALDEANALGALVGHWDAEKRCSVVPAPDPGGTGAEPGPPTIVKVNGIHPIPGSAPERVLVVMESNTEGFDAHGQGASIGGALFEKAGSGWRVVLRTDEVAEIGANGVAPEGKLEKLGPARWGVVFRPSFFSMGTEESGLAVVAEAGGALRLVLALPELALDNGGDCDGKPGRCYAWGSTLEWLPAAGRDWFDLVVKTEGTRPGDDGSIGKFSQARRYAFDGTAYREAAPAPDPAPTSSR